VKLAVFLNTARFIRKSEAIGTAPAQVSSLFPSGDFAMSHLTLQEVVERINKANPSAKDQPTTDNRTPAEQPHRPEFYIPRITRRVANFIFSAWATGWNTFPIFQECSNYLIVLFDRNCQNIFSGGRPAGSNGKQLE
jgi:hypothetical protein